MSAQESRLPRGWLATLIGGVLGAVVVGGLGLVVGYVLMDWVGTGGLEDLIYPLIGSGVGAWIGSAVGVTIFLRIFKHRRAFASGVMSSVLVSMTLTVCGVIADKVTPPAFNETVGVVLLFVVPPVAGALLTRLVFEEREEA